eukprot:TRINITY_DN5444_c0_g1_i1.p1 TRINITY_DN5444_c0_g1~~TRINITY_DN5444_c0_g1_i1.p1  ORF type:complete len:860 (-),score=116.73 TRINITY_DN5444_c0_g1_i1:41-2284(-)
MQLGPGVLGNVWGTTLALAFVTEVTTSLQTFAEGLAGRWFKAQTANVSEQTLLLVLRADGTPAAALGGSWATSLDTVRRHEVERQVGLLMRDGQISLAATTFIRMISEVFSGTFLHGDFKVTKIKQRMLAEGRSAYQDLELWESSCGERRCLELFLGNVRQLSDRFEAYYHEAMVFPALVALGRERGRRVLILGGGDGGIATHALRFDSVEQVVVVELDAEVANISRTYFPALASGYFDERCHLIIADAFAWVRERTDARSEASKPSDLFDLIILDFTDEPIEGAWSASFFKDLKQLLSPHGLMIQNVGTYTSESLLPLLHTHQNAYSKVHVMSTLIPDYNAPYLLSMCSDSTDVLKVDRQFWDDQRIVSKYYTPRLHNSLFVLPAVIASTVHVPVSSRPSAPMPLPAFGKQDMIPPDLPCHEEDFGDKVSTVKSPYHTISIFRADDKAIEDGHALEFTEDDYTLRLTSDPIISPSANVGHELMVLPAMNLLGDSARSVLVLGGGSGALVRLVLRYPSVRRVVVVELDSVLLQTVRGEASKFPSLRAALADGRVEVVEADALDWLASCDERGTFDLVLLDLSDAPWRRPSRLSRAPRHLGVYRRLAELMAPSALLAQDIGSIATIRGAAQLVDLHKTAFTSTWVLNYAKHDDNVESRLGVKVALDGYFVRPPRLLALSAKGSAIADPLAVDWARWEALQLRTSYYHASLHAALFALPAELLRRFGVNGADAGANATASLGGHSGDEL